jgi:hypothetical protein
MHTAIPMINGFVEIVNIDHLKYTAQNITPANKAKRIKNILSDKIVSTGSPSHVVSTINTYFMQITIRIGTVASKPVVILHNE